MRKIIIILAALVITSLPNSTALAQRSISVQPGRYEIEVALTGKVLDLRREDMRTVQQYFRGKVANQQWDIQSAGNGYYYIRSAQNSGYLSIEGNANGARVTVSPNNRQNSLWRFLQMDEGTVMIANRSGQVLDLTAGGTEDGVLLQAWSQAGNTHQRFRLVPLTTMASNDRDTYTNRSENNGAYRVGMEDRAANLARNYRRHRDLYDRNSEREFEQNYNAGYDNDRNRGTYRNGDDNSGNVYNDDLSNLSPSDRRVYDQAYQLGRQDARSRYSLDHRRYSDRYERRQEDLFRRGYEAGYYNRNNSNNDQFDLNRLSATERRAYNDGYRLGQQDARAGYSLDYRRYNDRYNSQQESVFQRGYEVGYNSTRRYQ